MLSLFYALIKPFGHTVPLFVYLTHDYSVTSGLEDESDRGFGLIGGRLHGPAEPLLFRFHCYRSHAGTGGARNRWISVSIRLNRAPLTAISASWKVIVRA